MIKLSKYIVPLGGCQKFINNKFACTVCHLNDKCAIYEKKINNWVEEESKKYSILSKKG
jgi:hypothetical protein